MLIFELSVNRHMTDPSLASFKPSHYCSNEILSINSHLSLRIHLINILH